LVPSKRSTFDDETPNELAHTEKDADDVLLHVDWVTFDDSSTDLDENHLDNESEDNYTDELDVSGHTGEDVEFSVFDLTSVDLVEELHENEGLEDHSVMDKFLGWSTKFLLVWEESLLVIWALSFIFRVSKFSLPAGEFMKGIFVVLVGIFTSLFPELKRVFGLIELGGIECVVFVASLTSIGGILVLVASSPVNFAHPAWEGEHNDHEHNDLVNSVAENVSPHDWGDDKVILLVWGSKEDFIGWWFSGKGESAEGIHDQVDPEHLDGSKRRILKDDGSEENDEHGDDVNRELELQEFSYVIIDVSSVFQSNDNGAEVIIEKDNITSVLSNISTSDTHGKTDIGFGKSRSVIGTITCNSDDLSTVLHTGDENLLILWGASTKNSEVLFDFIELVLVTDCVNFDLLAFNFLFNFLHASNNSSEIFTDHAGVIGIAVLTFFDLVFGNDSSVFRDSSGCDEVITSTHDNGDSSSMAFCNGFDNTNSKWILDTEDAEGAKSFFQDILFFIIDEASVLFLEALEFFKGQSSERGENGSVSIVSEGGDSIIEILSVGLTIWSF